MRPVLISNCFSEPFCASLALKQGRKRAHACRYAHVEHRQVQGSRTHLSDSGCGRNGRRKMGVPDPAGRLQRAPSFRGVPGGVGHCQEHSLGPAVEDGVRRHSRALNGPGRQAAGDLFPHPQGRRPVAGRSRASPMGRGMGLRKDRYRPCRSPRRTAGAQDVRPGA
jgi:hypothetical protein